MSVVEYYSSLTYDTILSTTQANNTVVTSLDNLDISELGLKVVDGLFDINNQKIINVTAGTANDHAINKLQLDNAITGIPAPDLSLLMRKVATTDLDMNGVFDIQNLKDPTTLQQPTSKKYVDDKNTLQDTSINNKLDYTNGLTSNFDCADNNITNIGTCEAERLDLLADPALDTFIRLFVAGGSNNIFRIRDIPNALNVLEYRQATGNWRFNIPIDMQSSKIEDMADPTALQDAATKNYVDNQIPSVPSLGNFTFATNSITSSTAFANLYNSSNDGICMANDDVSICMNEDPHYQFTPVHFNIGGKPLYNCSSIKSIISTLELYNSSNDGIQIVEDAINLTHNGNVSVAFDDDGTTNNVDFIRQNLNIRNANGKGLHTSSTSCVISNNSAVTTYFGYAGGTDHFIYHVDSQNIIQMIKADPTTSQVIGGLTNLIIRSPTRQLYMDASSAILSYDLSNQSYIGFVSNNRFTYAANNAIITQIINTDSFTASITAPARNNLRISNNAGGFINIDSTNIFVSSAPVVVSQRKFKEAFTECIIKSDMEKIFNQICSYKYKNDSTGKLNIGPTIEDVESILPMYTKNLIKEGSYNFEGENVEFKALDTTSLLFLLCKLLYHKIDSSKRSSSFDDTREKKLIKRIEEQDEDILKANQKIANLQLQVDKQNSSILAIKNMVLKKSTTFSGLTKKEDVKTPNGNKIKLTRIDKDDPNIKGKNKMISDLKEEVKKNMQRKRSNSITKTTLNLSVG